MIKLITDSYFRIGVFSFAALVFTVMHCQGQITRPGNPLPLEYVGSPKLKIYELPLTATQKSRALDSGNQSLLKPAKSGIMIDVDISPENDGIWDTVTNGMKIWRAAFHTNDAALMNLVFAPYQLNKGVKVFLYDRYQQNVLGAFTDLNNKPVNMLATAFVPGDLLIIELQVPGYLDSPGIIKIAGVGCDFSNLLRAKSLKDGWYGMSDFCNIDINCVEDSVYQIIKKAVVRIVFDGGERCTGTLINNTLYDGLNYVITAEHCISTESSANAAVFYFDYESPWCGGPDGSNHKSISGATLRATGGSLDFSLLELLEPVPFNYQPYYAGWDQSGYPPSSGYTIHHPLGDVKKISRENHSLMLTSYGHGYDDLTHWLVRHWESGTTEAGSSGGAFFDQYGRIAGTLTGGQANCSSSVNDYFQMFSHSWEDYSSPDKQLAFWLDPVKKNPGYLNGYDPYSDFWATGDTLSNISPGESLTDETGSLAWGSYSGHNSEYLTAFAEKYSQSAGRKLLGLLLQVSHNYVASSMAQLIVSVWEGDQIPGNLLYEKEISLADLAEGDLNFVEFDSIISVGKNFFAGYQVHYSAAQDTFSTYMAANRIDEQVNSAFVYDGSNWQALDDYTGDAVHTSFAVMPIVFDSLPETADTSGFTNEVIAYPNPTSSEIWLEFREMSLSPVHITMYNTQGQLVLEKDFGPYQRIIRLEQLVFSQGIYIIHVRQGEMIHNLKITIMK